jgi:hypothetical protein
MQRKDRFRGIVSDFGATCKQALLHGQKEAAIRRAVETLLVDAARVLGLQAVLHAEVAITAHRIRPDLAVRIGKLPRNIVGLCRAEKPRQERDPSWRSEPAPTHLRTPAHALGGVAARPD